MPDQSSPDSHHIPRGKLILVFLLIAVVVAAVALFGYLPTPAQIREGGYEVEGFQPLFGLSGTFDAEKITPAVIHCVKQAVAGLEPAG